MSFIEFEHSLANDREPPPRLSAPLRALWLQAKGDWNGAHALAQAAGEADNGGQVARDGNWVHAYLHRKEGDESNAAYWYSRAGRPVSSAALPEEWEEIVRALLQSPAAD